MGHPDRALRHAPAGRPRQHHPQCRTAVGGPLSGRLLDQLQWIVDAYAIASVGLLLTLGALPGGDAGVGSATSDISMQIGGALGVGVLGTVLNLRCQAVMPPPLAHLPIPPRVEELILGSIGGALAVAERVHGSSGAALAQAARRGCVSGMDLGLIVAASVVGVAGPIVLAALANRALGTV